MIRLALCVLLVWIVLAVIGQWLPITPNLVELDKILAVPGQYSLLGHDDLGRSVFERLIVGARVSLIVSVSVVTVSVFIGVSVGLVSAYFGGWLDRVVVVLIDMVMAFPGLLLAIALAGIMGPSLTNVVLALCVVSWVGFARLTRAQVLSIKHREHVQAAIALGIADNLVMFRHVLPLAMAPIIVEASFGVASVVIAEAGLSFLGLGVQAPDASWGNMIRDGARYLLVAPHLVLVPSLTLLSVVAAINLLGDYMRDRLDVRGSGVGKRYTSIIKLK